MIYCFCHNSLRDNESQLNISNIELDKYSEYVKCNYPNCRNYMHKICLCKEYKKLAHINCIQCILQNNDPLRPIFEILTEKIIQATAKLEFTINKILFDNFLNDTMVLEVRCIKLQSSYIKLHEQNWPNKCFISLNGKDIKHFNIEKKNKDLKFQTRDHINLGNNWIIIDSNSNKNREKSDIQDSPDRANQINHIDKLKEDVISSHDNNKIDDEYYIGIYVTTKIEKEKLLSKWRINNLLTREKSMNMIKELFIEKKYNKISKILIYLNCSFDQKILNIPARGVHCRHITCFSLMNLIINNEKCPNQYWNCPICKLPCYQVIIDSYLEDIVNISKAKKLFENSVIFYRNGFYEFREIKSNTTSQKEPLIISDDDNENVNSSILLNNFERIMNKNPNNSHFSKEKFLMDDRFGIGQLIKDIKILIEIYAPITRSNCNDSNESLLTKSVIIPNIVTFESLTTLLGLVLNNDILNRFDMYTLLYKCLKGFDKLYSIIKHRFNKNHISEFLSAIFSYLPKNINNVVIQILKIISLLFIKESKIQISQDFWLHLIRIKSIYSTIEERLFRFVDNFDKYHDLKLRNPFKLKINYFGLYQEPTEFNGFHLKVFDNVSSMKLNWAHDYELADREKLWKILWDSKTRWFKVKISEKIQNVYNQDPYSIIFSDDIKFLMSRIMYLKLCWIEDMKDYGDIPIKIDTIMHKVAFEIKPLEFFITPEKITIEKLVHSTMNVSDSLGDELSFIHINPIKSLKKPYKPLTYEKLKNDIINSRNIIEGE